MNIFDDSPPIESCPLRFPSTWRRESVARFTMRYHLGLCDQAEVDRIEGRLIEFRAARDAFAETGKLWRALEAA